MLLILGSGWSGIDESESDRVTWEERRVGGLGPIGGGGRGTRRLLTFCKFYLHVPATRRSSQGSCPCCEASGRSLVKWLMEEKGLGVLVSTHRDTKGQQQKPMHHVRIVGS